ncbi:MAG TPA: DUF4870 domain-containing protein [Candidatus Solibacter sp.]|nr:DUF4870 domain-containing protein [Candidatus Solibacter sp.]
MADTTYIGSPDLAATTSDERSMAVLSHALQVVGGWIPPLIIFFVKRQSRFVSFHSLQVLFLELAYLAVTMFTMTFWIAGVLLIVSRTHENSNGIPAALFLFFPIFWLVWMFVWISKIVVAVIYSIKAGRGEWAEIPVVGGWARSVLKIGPGGGSVV